MPTESVALTSLLPGKEKTPPADRGELHAGGGSRCYTTILRVVTHLNPGLLRKFRCMEKSFAELDRGGKQQVAGCISGPRGSSAKERRGNGVGQRTADPSTTAAKEAACARDDNILAVATERFQWQQSPLHRRASRGATGGGRRPPRQPVWRPALQMREPRLLRLKAARMC